MPITNAIHDWSGRSVYVLTGHAVETTKQSENAQFADTVQMVSEYGREGQQKAFSMAFKELRITKDVHLRVTIENVEQLFSQLPHEERTRSIVINTCDGTDADGYPGPSVVRMLNRMKIPYTGGNEDFFLNTTSKLTIKKLFAHHNVPSADYVDLSNWPLNEDVISQLKKMKFPAVVKPDVSYSSCGITVVWNWEEALSQADKLRTSFGNCYVERFVNGKEFTVLTVGDIEHGVKVYEPAQRAFNKSLEWHQKLLTYERYWGLDKKEGEKLDYWYEPAPQHLKEELKRIAAAAYLAVGGRSYSRVDVRMDDSTQKFFVLEVNCHCALSTEPDSSMGNILNFEGESFGTFLDRLLHLAVLNSEEGTPRTK